MKKGLDTAAYHKRYNISSKVKCITDYVLNEGNTKTLTDVGCNTGEISKRLIDNDIEVNGIDLQKPEVLNISPNYNFTQMNIIEKDWVDNRDCTLFLSIYHHLLTHNSLEAADEVFYKLLFKSRYLIFDTGTPEDTGSHPVRKEWRAALLKHFKTEIELFDHFGIPYEIIGKWKSGVANRRIVVFKKKDAEAALKVEEEYKRYKWSKNYKKALVKKDNWDKNKNLFNGSRYYKLTLGNKIFFGKQYINDTPEAKKDWKASNKTPSSTVREAKNTVAAHKNIDYKKLLTYYGYSEVHDMLLFPYIENIKVKKPRNIVKVSDNLELRDVDIIDHNNSEIYIDFDW